MEAKSTNKSKKIIEQELMFLLWSLLCLFAVPLLLAWLRFGAILVLGLCVMVLLAVVL